MGSLFLDGTVPGVPNLAEVCRRAMPFVADVIEVDGWQRRARGSGGYPGRVKGRSGHHDAGSPLSDGWPAVNYETFISSARPVTNLHLDRTAQLWVCAGGATNTVGKGGPLGDFGLNDGNAWQLGIEQGNDGRGEPWPEKQVRAAIELDAVLFEAYGSVFGWHFPVTREQFFDHWEWTSRKIDRKGDARCTVDDIEYVFADGYRTWDTDLYRQAVSRRVTTRATPTPITEEDNHVKQLNYNGMVLVYTGHGLRRVKSGRVSVLLAQDTVDKLTLLDLIKEVHVDGPSPFKGIAGYEDKDLDAAWNSRPQYFARTGSAGPTSGTITGTITLG